MYAVIFLIALMFIVLPILAEKYSSVKASIFLFSLGYAGLSLNERTNDKRLQISEKEYLNISKKAQSIFGISLILMITIMYFLNVNQYLLAVMILPVGFIGSILVWHNLKKYKI
ncbi:MAG: hypothetical protein ACRDD2_02640 [Sarcina sp.]